MALHVGYSLSPFVGTLGFGSDKTIQANQWIHVAFVFSGATGYVYANGRPTGSYYSGPLSVPQYVNRTNSFIGKSTYRSVYKAVGFYDDLKIYDGALTSGQILNDFTQSFGNF